MFQGHTLEPIVAKFLTETTMELQDWLQGLHGVVCSEPLRLPAWCCRGSFRNLARSTRDNQGGAALLKLLDDMRSEIADGGLATIVFPPREARPDLAMVLGRSILMSVGCKMLEGLSNHAVTYSDNMASTDVKQLWVKQGKVIDESLRAAAARRVRNGALHVVRVAFDIGSKARGGVTTEAGEVHVVISPPMLATAFAGVPWANQVERLLYQAGIAPHVQVLDDDAGAKLQRHVHNFGPTRSKTWATALPRLCAEYDAADPATRDTVAGVVDIIDYVFAGTQLRNALFSAANVAIWRFGGFVYTPHAMVTFAALKKRRSNQHPDGQPRSSKRRRQFTKKT